MSNAQFEVTVRHMAIFPDSSKNATVVHLFKPPVCTTLRRAKRKRNDKTECINIEQNTSDIKQTTPAKKKKLTKSDYKLHKNTGKSKEFKHQ